MEKKIEQLIAALASVGLRGEIVHETPVIVNVFDGTTAVYLYTVTVTVTP